LGANFSTICLLLHYGRSNDAAAEQRAAASAGQTRTGARLRVSKYMAAFAAVGAALSVGPDIRSNASILLLLLLL
jgi:hypothetical protein